MNYRVFPGTRILRAVSILLLLAVAGGVLAQAPACTLPAAMAPSPEQTAWQLFVAANCPSSSKAGPLAWQSWTEQTCWLAPTTPGCSATSLAAAPAQRFLHSSQLRNKKLGLAKKGAGAAGINPLAGACSAMTTKAQGPPLSNFVPANLAANPQFCEEVYVNPAEATFVTSNKLTTLAGQIAYAAQPGHNPITFPTPAVEVKADWLPASSVTPSFNCTTNPPPGVYVETINGACYALAGLHISSKLAPNWLWATFEPQSKITNPNRCNPKLYSVCNDSWGSNPAVSSGASTAPTPALVQLMTAAGLPKVFQNYRLVGTQTTFVTNKNVPIPLGNSFTEYNAEVLPKQASCITCHSYAGITTSPVAPVSCCSFPVMVGTPPATPPKTLKDDFSWMLPFMPTK